MKEYTLIYKAEITEVVTTDEPLEHYIYRDKNELANWIGSKLNADNVHIKDIKVFEREVEE